MSLCKNRLWPYFLAAAALSVPRCAAARTGTNPAAAARRPAGQRPGNLPDSPALPSSHNFVFHQRGMSEPALRGAPASPPAHTNSIRLQARFTRKMLAPTIIVQTRAAAISPPGTPRPARFGRAAFTFRRSLYLSVPLLYHSIRALTAFLPNFEKFSLFDILFVYSMPSPRDTWRIAPGILFEQAVFLAGIGVRPRFLSFVLFCKI